MSSKSSSAAACLDGCLDSFFASLVEAFFAPGSDLKRSFNDGPDVLDDVAFSLPFSLVVAAGEGALELEVDLEVFSNFSSAAEALRFRSVFSFSALLPSISFPLLLSLLLSIVFFDVDAIALALPAFPDYMAVSVM